MYPLRYREEWPLWSVQKKIYGTQVWVELDDVPPMEGQWTGMKRLIQELGRLETMLRSAGIVGWIASVEKGNAKMQKALTMLKAVPYATDETYQYFRKFAGVPPIPSSVMAIARGGRTWH